MSDEEFKVHMQEGFAMIRDTIRRWDARTAAGIPADLTWSERGGCYVRCDTAEQAFIAGLPKKQDFGNNFIGEGD